MGKEKWAADRHGKWATGSATQRWSAKQWQEWEAKQNAKNKEAPSFPAYKQMGPEPVPAKGHGADGNATDVSYLQLIQKAINSVRRVEQKLRKNGEETKKADEQWALFEEQIKQTWLTQRAQYHKDVKALQDEVADLQTQRVAALGQLQEVVQIGEKPIPTRMPRLEMTRADDQAWQALVQSPMDVEEDSQQSLEAWMTQARSMMAQGLPATGKPTGNAAEAFTTPPRNGTGVLPMTPAGKTLVRDKIQNQDACYAGGAGGLPQILKDPYMPSPLPNQETASLMASPLLAPDKGMSPTFGKDGKEVSRTRSQFGNSQQRVSVKQGTMAAPPKAANGGQKLADKLEERRKQLTHAEAGMVQIVDDDYEPETDRNNPGFNAME